jgi:hypothetical protein
MHISLWRKAEDPIKICEPRQEQGTSLKPEIVTHKITKEAATKNLVSRGTMKTWPKPRGCDGFIALLKMRRT